MKNFQTVTTLSILLLCLLHYPIFTQNIFSPTYKDVSNAYKIATRHIENKFEYLKSSQLNAREWDASAPAFSLNGFTFTPIVYNEGDFTQALKWHWHTSSAIDGYYASVFLDYLLNAGRANGVDRWENVSHYKDGVSYISWYGRIGENCLVTIQSTTVDNTTGQNPKTTMDWMTMSFWYEMN